MGAVPNAKPFPVQMRCSCGQYWLQAACFEDVEDGRNREGNRTRLAAQTGKRCRQAFNLFD
jgi:hypothetical protein